MIYGYIRVSTDKQTVENQRFEIKNFCKKNNIEIASWVEETISGTKELKKRTLGILLDKMQKGDVLIASEISRLGRNILMIMGILNECMNRDISVWTIKENYRLGNDISSKVLAFAFSMSAEIERQLISQRITEALKRKKADGVVLGRPLGIRNSSVKLTGKDAEIKELLDKRISKSAIARILGIHRLTVTAYIERMKDIENGSLNMISNKRVTVTIEEVDEIKKEYAKGIPVHKIAENMNIRNRVVEEIATGKARGY